MSNNPTDLTYNLEGILMHGVDLAPPRLPLGLLPLLLDLILAQRNFLLSKSSKVIKIR